MLVALALWVLHRELAALSFDELRATVAALPRSRIVVALLIVAVNYVVLTAYDQLAFVYARRRISRWRIAMASFVGYAISNNVGFAIISGASARYRFYSRWGLSAHELSKIVAFYSGTFWVGLLMLGGISLLAAPLPGMEQLVSAGGVRLVGGLLLAACGAYVVMCLTRRSPVRVGGVEIPLPGPALVAGQIVLSTIDWALLAAALYALLPEPRLPFLELVGAVLAAQLVALVSHVPGGLGVFESVMVLLLHGTTPSTVLLPSLVLFRVLYYLVPLGASLVVLLVDETIQRRHHVARWGNAFGTLALAIAPKLFGVFTFIAGAVLLFSGATPMDPERVGWLRDAVPLPLVEAGHFAGSVAGLGLLLVSQGLGRRLEAGYYLSVAGLVVGMIASLLKGADYEEATLMAGLLAILVPARANFTRKAAFFEASFSPEWLLGVVAVVAGSVWLGMFAFRHVPYSDALWWRFALEQDQSRFLRASAGVAVMLLAFGITRLLRPAPPEVPALAEDDLEQAAHVIDLQDETFPNLVFLRDKGLIWNEARTGFIMYGVEGRSWVALGDPVGPPEEAPMLVRRFLERVDDFNGVPVFYEVRHDALHFYADYGLTFVALGDEARLPLTGFSLDDPARAALRGSVDELARAGATFRVLGRDEVTARMDELKGVSDAWLEREAAHEKGFSSGFFDADYLARFPVAVIERDGIVVAFASLWPSGRRVELSLDLMRKSDEAPSGAMEALFVHLMQWGHDQGYRWLALGMAPLSRVEPADVSPLWVKVGSFVYRHGEAFYTFQSLAGYKEKFAPEWQPRYLAYPGGLYLPRLLEDVSALIAGHGRPARK